MDIDWVQITHRDWVTLFCETNAIKSAENSHSDIDQWSDVYLYSDNKALRIDFVELSDETGEDINYRNYYYKGLIQ